MEKTNTTIFMVPTLKIPKDKLKENGFINAYIKDEMNDTHYEGCVFLLFHPNYSSRFRKFLNLEYVRTKAIVDDYDCPNGFVVVVYKLDSRFDSDYELIKQSKYSKTSKEFQYLFPTTVEIIKDGKSIKEKSLQYRVFNQTYDLKKYWQEKYPLYIEYQELWFPFDETKEILNEAILKDIFWNKFHENATK